MRFLMPLLALLLISCSTHGRAGQVQTGYITAADGARLYFEKSGTGPEIVIAPGGLFLEPWLGSLADDFIYIRYYPRNRGSSQKIENLAQVGVSKDIQDLESVRRHFGIERFNSVAWSYLGPVTAAYALEHPGRVKRLVLIGPPPFSFDIKYQSSHSASAQADHLDPEEAAAVEKLRPKNADYAQAHAFCLAQQRLWTKQMVASSAALSSVEKFPVRACAHANEWPMNFYPHLGRLVSTYPELRLTPDRLAQLNAPVLVVHGARDRNAAIGAGVDWAHYLPGGRLLRVDDAAHLVVAEKPEIVTAIKRFLRGEWPTAATKPSQPAPRTN